MKIFDESAYCLECNCRINTSELKFLDGYCDDCYTAIQAQKEAEKEKGLYCIAMLHTSKSYVFARKNPMWCVVYTTDNPLKADRILRKLQEKAYNGLCGTSYADSRMHHYRLLVTSVLDAKFAGLRNFDTDNTGPYYRIQYRVLHTDFTVQCHDKDLLHALTVIPRYDGFNEILEVKPVTHWSLELSSFVR